MIRNFKKMIPNIHGDSFIAENASVIGDVNIEKGASIWYNAVLRGDIANISLGKYSNIQDNSTIHTGIDIPSIIGDYTVVGHNVIIHSATIGNNCLIGMGAIILDKTSIGDNCIIGAGTIITKGEIIPPNSLVVGSPGRIIRRVTKEEMQSIKDTATRYYELYREYKNI